MRFPAGGDGLLPRHADRLGAEHRAHGGAHRLFGKRIGAAVRQQDRQVEGVRRAEDRTEIAGVLNAVQQKRPRQDRAGLPLRQAAEEDRALRRVHQRDGLHHIPGYTDNAHGI